MNQELMDAVRILADYATEQEQEGGYTLPEQVSEAAKEVYKYLDKPNLERDSEGNYTHDFEQNKADNQDVLCVKCGEGPIAHYN